MKQKEAEKTNYTFLFCMTLTLFLWDFYKLDVFVVFFVLVCFCFGWLGFGIALILKCVMASLAVEISGRRKCILNLSFGFVPRHTCMHVRVQSVGRPWLSLTTSLWLWGQCLSQAWRLSSQPVTDQWAPGTTVCAEVTACTTSLSSPQQTRVLESLNLSPVACAAST